MSFSPRRIFLAAPTTAEERLASICAAAEGFLYYVSFAGITGADRLSMDDVRARVARIKRSAKTPVAVGFGVRDAQPREVLVRRDAEGLLPPPQEVEPRHARPPRQLGLGRHVGGVGEHPVADGHQPAEHVAGGSGLMLPECWAARLSPSTA